MERCIRLVYAEIADQIDLDNYDIYSAYETATGAIEIRQCTKESLLNEYLSVLIPKNSAYSIVDFTNSLHQHKVLFRKSYKKFYDKQFADIQRQFSNSILITQNVSIQSEEFVSCPINSEYLVIYSAEVYAGKDCIERWHWGKEGL